MARARFRQALTLAALLAAAGCAPTTQVVAEQFHLPPGGKAAAGRKVFDEMGCGRCHAVNGQADLQSPSAKSPGPELGVPGASRVTDARLVTAIINPSHRIHDGDPDNTTADGSSRMQALNDQMTVQQLLDLIAFLRAAEGA